jgi:broad specificity phosphatase PhoE
LRDSLAGKQEFAEEVLALGGALVSAEPLEKDGGADRDKNARGLAAGLSAATIVPDARLTDFMRYAIQTTVLQGRPVICVKPSADADDDDESSVRSLLGMPAKELLKMGGAWRERRFAAALDDRPLAEEAPEDPYDLVSRLQRAVDAELRDPLPPRWWFGLEQRNGPPLDAHAATRLLRADAGF